MLPLVVCHPCPLAGFLLSQELVTTQEGHLGLLVAVCPINTPRTKALANIKVIKATIRDPTKVTKGTQANKAKEIEDSKDILVATRIGVEAAEATVVIVEADSEARTVIIMAATAEVVVEVTTATRDNGIATLSSSL
jgi:hypothetical protein